MGTTPNAALAEPWKDLWNGDLTGTDTLRIADGMLAEYWANADSLLFFQQLGIREVPVQG